MQISVNNVVHLNFIYIYGQKFVNLSVKPDTSGGRAMYSVNNILSYLDASDVFDLKITTHT